MIINGKIDIHYLFKVLLTKKSEVLVVKVKKFMNFKHNIMSQMWIKWYEWVKYRNVFYIIQAKNLINSFSLFYFPFFVLNFIMEISWIRRGYDEYIQIVKETGGYMVVRHMFEPIGVTAFMKGWRKILNLPFLTKVIIIGILKANFEQKRTLSSL